MASEPGKSPPRKANLPISLFVMIVSISAFMTAAAPSPGFGYYQSEQPIPEGFRLVLSERGAQLYRKDYAGGNPDYVQVIDLSQGAQVSLLYGELGQPRPYKGAFGGDDPHFLRQSLDSFWNELTSSSSTAFCVTNGSFFSMQEYPSGITHPLKVEGSVISEGYGIKDHPGQKLMLEIWEDRLDITDLSRRNLYSSSAPDILGGLTEDANKKPKNFTGRTFAGIDDRNGDGKFETIIILNTLTARQIDAAQVIRDFGADKVIQFDGGGSTQLICHDRPYVFSERLIPQSIAISAGEVPPHEGKIFVEPNWTVVSQDQTQKISIEINNSGTETWQGDAYQMVIANKQWGEGIEYKFPRPVPSKDQIRLSWETPQFSNAGVSLTEIYLSHTSDKFPSVPFELYTVVLPASLEEYRRELELLIGDAETLEDREKALRVTEWLQEKTGELPQDTIKQPTPVIASAPQSEKPPATSQNLEDASWVPLIILPIALIILFILLRNRRNQ